MNDFTKEELIMLKRLTLQHVNQFRENSDCIALLNKIQSMIENYCEHETDGYTYYKSGERCTDFLTYACSDSPCFLKCKKCEELFR